MWTISKVSLTESVLSYYRPFYRHRKELRAIAEEMLRVRLGPKAPVIVLYSLEETHKFRIMC